MAKDKWGPVIIRCNECGKVFEQWPKRGDTIEATCRPCINKKVKEKRRGNRWQRETIIPSLD